MAEQLKEKAPTLMAERLPYHPAFEERFGVDRAKWRALIDAIFPTAKTTEGVLLAMTYCKARGLDLFKRPVHVVPMYNSALGREVETVWPGIGELRTTAHRTGLYAGCDETQFGPMVENEQFTAVKEMKSGSKKLNATVSYPEWAQVTVYRLIAGQRVPFAGPRVYWKENYSGAMGTTVPNARWCRAPRQMIEKVAEAAALRKAFPEECGEYTAEEMEGKVMAADGAVEASFTVGDAGEKKVSASEDLAARMKKRGKKDEAPETVEPQPEPAAAAEAEDDALAGELELIEGFESEKQPELIPAK